MVETIQLNSGVTLKCCRDGRFKHGTLSIELIRPMRASEAAMNALIPSVLLRGTRKHPDLRSVTMALDDLYGASVSPLVRRAGDYQTTGLICGFMDPRFALPGDQVLEPMIRFLRELLLESPTWEDGFLPEFVDSEKKNLISSIEADLNDKQVYAMTRMLKCMCREDSFGVPRLGEKEQIEAITPRALYRHYGEILRESQILIFYVGSDEPSRVAELLQPLFDLPGRCPMALPEQSDFRRCPEQDVTETMEVTQGKLCLGFTTDITNRTEGFAAMQMLNTVFGGGMTSKLFMHVREEQSLCYSIGSGYYGVKGILTVWAGIDNGMRDRVQGEILHQLALCQEGEITEDEMTSAREALLSSLRGIPDSPGAIESYYATAHLSGNAMSPEAYMDAICRVTREQVAAAAKSVKLNTGYFLKGECP